ncbi:MAG: 30S ribosomal protein S20 [bacterium]|nr:30S ribosomal protein S20 [bacterium]
MAITKSAKKAFRQSQRRRVGNSEVKEKIKNLLKEMQSLIAEKKIEEVKKNLSQIYKALDKATKVGVIKKNAASRKKSRLAKLISKLTPK